MGSWGAYPRFGKTRPRRAAGGIKAKSRQGAIGETWWSKRFVAVLESFEMGARLGRGRSYARSGQVMNLEIAPGLATALVQGSRARPYRVRIGVKTLPERNWSRVEQAMAEKAIFLAKLLAGEMPRDIEEAFSSCRLSLFPDSLRDLETDCSCPDWANPCKHIAATYYILAERFDEDPFLILAWRGRTREILLERLRGMRGASETETDGPTIEEHDGGPHGEPLAADIGRFWERGVDLSELRIRPEAAPAPDATLRQLGPSGIRIGKTDVALLLARAYPHMARAAEARAFGGEEPVATADGTRSDEAPATPVAPRPKRRGRRRRRGGARAPHP
ncbi:MAG: SWIM zinc finger family protein [Deltaproteobacteria bacterium]|nr:SWIM zinc finger family protein [Deltaproteobacteria bacterium]